MEKGNKPSPILAFAGAGLQMMAIIVAFIFAGKYLDAHFYQSEKKTFTIVLTMLSIVLSLILFIKKAMDISKRND